MSSNPKRIVVVPLDGTDGVDAALVGHGNTIGLALSINTATESYAVGLDTDQAATLARKLTLLLAADPDQLHQAVTDYQFDQITKENDE